MPLSHLGNILYAIVSLRRDNRDQYHLITSIEIEPCCNRFFRKTFFELGRYSDIS